MITAKAFDKSQRIDKADHRFYVHASVYHEGPCTNTSQILETLPWHILRGLDPGTLGAVRELRKGRHRHTNRNLGVVRCVPSGGISPTTSGNPEPQGIGVS